MGEISKLIVTLILIAVIAGMWFMGLWETQKIIFGIVSVICVAIGAKIWLD